jgi:hypothetical protein
LPCRMNMMLYLLITHDTLFLQALVAISLTANGFIASRKMRMVQLIGIKHVLLAQGAQTTV